MKKLFLFVSAALILSLPAAALGAKPPPKKARPQAALTAKNSAWACKQLRAQNASAFKTAFGTNRNKSNAYGKCVSLHARAAGKHRPLQVTLKNLIVSSTGTITAIDNNPTCNQSTAGCTLTSTGTLNGVVGGTYPSTWTIFWTQA